MGIKFAFLPVFWLFAGTFIAIAGCAAPPGLPPPQAPLADSDSTDSPSAPSAAVLDASAAELVRRIGAPFSTEEELIDYIDTHRKELTPALNRQIEGRTPLQQAILKLKPGVARRLLTLGADPNLLSSGGSGALAFAIDWNDLELVKHLVLHGADFNAINPRTRWTPVMEAENNNRTELVQYLEALGAGRTFSVKDFHTVAAAACLDGANSEQRLEQVLTATRIDPNTRDAVGNPLIWTPIWNNACKAITVLLDHGADPVIALQLASKYEKEPARRTIETWIEKHRK